MSTYPEKNMCHLDQSNRTIMYVITRVEFIFKINKTIYLMINKFIFLIKKKIVLICAKLTKTKQKQSAKQFWGK